MSNNVNTELLDRAADMVEYFESKLPAQLILKALDENDLDLVRRYVVEAEAMAAQTEMYGYDVLPKEAEDVF